MDKKSNWNTIVNSHSIGELHLNLKAVINKYIRNINEYLDEEHANRTIDKYQYNNFRDLPGFLNQCPSIMDIYSIEDFCHIFGTSYKSLLDPEISSMFQNTVNYLRDQRLTKVEIAYYLNVDLRRLNKYFQIKNGTGKRKITLDQERIAFHYIKNNKYFLSKQEIVYGIWYEIFDIDLSPKTVYNYLKTCGVSSPQLQQNAMTSNLISESQKSRNALNIWIKMKKTEQYCIIFAVRANGEYVFTVQDNDLCHYDIAENLIKKSIDQWAKYLGKTMIKINFIIDKEYVNIFDFKELNLKNKLYKSRYQINLIID